MANILTASEAATVLRCETTDADMLALLPQVDSYIKNATGHDWAADNPVLPDAKSAARILLVRTHEDPGALAQPASALSWSLSACLVQLEAQALRYQSFEGRNGAGAIILSGARIGDTVSSLVGLIDATGDQHTSFETVITVNDHIQQVSTSDLTGKFYRAYLTPLESL